MNKQKFKFLGIQIFATLTVEAINKALEGLTEEKDIKAKLAELGIIKTEIKEVDKKITEADINKYLAENKKFSDGLGNATIKNYLAGKLNKKVEEVTEADINQELITKNSLDTEIKKYTNVIIDNALKTELGKNYDLLKPHVKSENIKIDKDFKIEGLEEQITALKTNYPTLFEAEESDPAGGTGNNDNKNKVNNPWTDEHWDANKQVELYKTNKELAEKFMEVTGYSY